MLCWMTGWLLCCNWINVWMFHYINEYVYDVYSLLVHLSHIKKRGSIAWYWSNLHASNPPSQSLLESLAQSQGTKTPSHANCRNVVLEVTHKTEIYWVRRHRCCRCYWLSSAPSIRCLGIFCAEKKGLNLGLGTERGKKANNRKEFRDGWTIEASGLIFII